MAIKKIEVDHDYQGVSRILNLPDPTNAQHASTKAYVDALIEGLAWKDSARAASTANVNLAAPGAALDGVTLAASDRVLLKDQTDQTENGIYVWTGAGTPLTRSDDASTGADLVNAVVPVEEGAANGGSTWRQTAVNITLGVTPIAFSPFGGSVPDATTAIKGKVELATAADIASNAAGPIAVPASEMVRTRSQTIGDGAATTFTITHNWGHRRVVVQVLDVTDSYAEVEVRATRPTDNTVEIVFPALLPPALGSRLVLLVEVRA